MVKKIFWILVINFVLILSQFFIPLVGDLFRGSLLFLLPFATFFLLGVVLIVTTIRKEAEGKLKKYLLLTGISSSGFFIGVLLHNIFYGLGMITKHIVFLFYLLEVLQVTFFIIAIFVCPIGFLIGIIGSLKYFNKNKTSIN